MIDKRTILTSCLVLGLFWLPMLPGSYSPLFADQRFTPPPVSLESRIILQTSAKFTQIALNLSRKVDFTERYTPVVGKKMGELRLSSPSWDFPRLRSLVTGDRLVHSVNLQKEKEGSSVRIRLRRPVSFDVRWIDDLFQLLITVSPDVEVQVAQSESPPIPPASKTEPRDVEKSQEIKEAGRRKEEGKDKEAEKEKRKKREGAIEVTADEVSVRERGEIIEAKESVEIQRENTVLKADEVRVNRNTTEVEAKGNVSVHDPEWKLKAKEIRLNLGKETGEIREGEVFIEGDHISLSGDRFQKLAGQVYHIDQGSFTTCLCELGAPSWKISADEMDLTSEGEGIIRGGTFYILDVPVFYLPYGYFPLRTKRQSGFLFPKIGSSSKEGFRFQQPFYWAISRSSDATFDVNVESRARVGILGEYRTVLNRNLSGQLNISYFNEAMRKDESDDVGNRTIADQEIPKDRWSIVATHRGTHGSGWQTYSDIFAFSDDLFTRELFEKFNLSADRERDVRTSRYGRSRFGLYKSWRDIHLQGDWKFFQDFVQEDEQTFQQTPRLSFWGRQTRGDTPVEFRWHTEGVNYLRKEGSDGLRVDLRPELLVPFRLASYLTGSFDVAARETAYHLYQSGGLSDRNPSRELVELSGNIGTSIGRVYPWNGSLLKKVKHIAEPRMSYLLASRSQQRDIPIMDGTDRINRRNLLNISLTNRLWERTVDAPSGLTQNRAGRIESSSATGQAQELGYLKLDLSYDIDKERKGGDSLSDLDVDFRLSPVDTLTLGLDAGLNPGPWHLTQAATKIFISDPRPLTNRVLDRDFMKPNHLGLSYRYIRRGVNSPLVENANLVSTTPGSAPVCPPPVGVFDPRCERLNNKNVLGELGLRSLFHWTDHLLLLYDSSYNTRDGRFTTNRGGIKFLSQCECWTLGFSINRTTNPDKTSFNFSFNLLGLGSRNTSPAIP